MRNKQKEYDRNAKTKNKLKEMEDIYKDNVYIDENHKLSLLLENYKKAVTVAH